MNHGMIEVNSVIRALRLNRIAARYFDDVIVFQNVIKEYFLPGMVIGVGDSLTLEELGVYDTIRSSESIFLDKYNPALTKEEKRNIYVRNFSCDLFVSGINAVTQEGKIFNLDGNGSRVAPIIYGPQRVVLICGKNKIVKDDAEAIERIKNIAAPLDAKRLEKKTPCVRTGECMDCKSPERICNYYSIIQGQFDKDRIKVFIINKDLGY